MSPDLFAGCCMGYGVAWIDKFANAFVSENVVHGYDVVTPRPFIKSAYQKNNFLISQQKHMLWVLRRTVSMKRSFEHPKHMLKLMGEKIFTILRYKILFTLTCDRRYDVQKVDAEAILYGKIQCKLKGILLL